MKKKYFYNGYTWASLSLFSFFLPREKGKHVNFSSPTTTQPYSTGKFFIFNENGALNFLYF